MHIKDNPFDMPLMLLCISTSCLNSVRWSSFDSRNFFSFCIYKTSSYHFDSQQIQANARGEACGAAGQGVLKINSSLTLPMPYSCSVRRSITVTGLLIASKVGPSSSSVPEASICQKSFLGFRAPYCIKGGPNSTSVPEVRKKVKTTSWVSGLLGCSEHLKACEGTSRCLTGVN